MNDMRPAKYLISLLLFALDAHAFTFPGLKLEGILRDEKTGEPIAGAYVAAAWEVVVSNPVGTRTTCPFLEVTRTDANGHYEVPKRKQEGGDVTITLLAFAPSYWPSNLDSNPPKVRRVGPDRASDVSAIQRFRGLTGCGRAGDSYRILRPLFLLIDEDIRKYGPPKADLLTQHLDDSEALRTGQWKRREQERR